MNHDELIALLTQRHQRLDERRREKAAQMQPCDPYDPMMVDRYIDFQRLDARAMELVDLIHELHRIEWNRRRPR